MLHAITDLDENSEFLAVFYERLRRGARKIEHVVGHQGRSHQHTLYWHKRPGLWAILEKNEDDNRSWNSFGTIDPGSTTKNLDIICEINFPHEGINRRVAAVFAMDDAGKVQVVHSGGIGGSKGPAAKVAVIEHYQRLDLYKDIAWPDGLTRVHEFVSNVEHYKSGANGSSTYAEEDEQDDDDDESSALTFSPEFSGPRAPYTPGTIEATVDHGLIVHALHDALRAALPRRQYSVGNDRHRDLVVQHKDTTIALFEVKPSTDLDSLYTAIGQLAYHSAKVEPRPLCILVVPAGLSPAIAQRLQHLDIEILEFRQARKRPAFPRLEQLVTQLLSLATARS